ncbi:MULTISPECIES: DUF1800 family protein [unclassified Sinorhizobium]|uniref:DUF1800 domain-containing protein n=1 Tax=unclassified Sinorhizobium TaxID=2613772 RepID=UPI0035253AFB
MSLSFSTMAAIRFGYGFRPGETPPGSKDELLNQVRVGAGAAPSFPVGGINRRHQQLLEQQQRLKDIRNLDDQAKRDARKVIQRQSQELLRRDADARLMQAALSPNGFYERLATFWTNHFSTSTSKSLPMRLLVPLYEAEAVRPHIGGSFRDLLRSATEHPAMLIYLDQALSQGPDSPNGMKRKKGLNENLGRELLELHTLGAGSGYTQADVRSAAMVLTGLTIDRSSMETTFRPGLAEPGEHDVLGVSYGGQRRTPGDNLALLDDLAANPKTAQHVSRKLAVHFISDQPPQELVEAMAEAWKKTDGNLMAVYGAMLDHPDAWRNEGAKARQPFDYIVTGLRALNTGDDDGNVGRFLEANEDTDDGDMIGQDMSVGEKATENMNGTEPVPMDTNDAADIKRRKAFRAARALGAGALRRMGQPIWQPPSPAGFEEGFDAWITASQLAERLAWARRASAQFGAQQDPRQFLKATLADAARDDTIRVVSQAPDRTSGLTLVLASPEFNRR